MKSEKLINASLHLAGKGKFIRGIYSYLFSKGLGADEDEALTLAISTELYHLASLIHDDIIDKAPYRRGLESVHKKYGIETAIIAGDLLIVYSNKLLSKLGCEIIDIYASAGVRLADGEALELEMDSPNSLDEYYKLIELKTSSVFEAMFESSVVLTSRKQMRDFARQLGRYLGYAFQMSDDLLDRIGDPVLMGKMTKMDKSSINIVSILTKFGYKEDDAINKVRELIRENVGKSIKYLNLFELNQEYKAILKSLIYVLEGRSL